jgi:hypothetical protein
MPNSIFRKLAALSVDKPKRKSYGPRAKRTWKQIYELAEEHGIEIYQSSGKWKGICKDGVDLTHMSGAYTAEEAERYIEEWIHDQKNKTQA